jgi:pimeloyl-ACP methyl ester carboxylesterase
MNDPFAAPRRIATNGVELEVFEAGRGRPVVLCHGWPELAYSWRHQMAPLATAGYHVLAPNQRGYGSSSRPEAVAAYDIVHLADDLTGLLDHYGYDDALFVGHDWGAIVVWSLAMLRPDRVAGVVNLSVPLLARGEEEWVAFWERMLGGDFYIVHFNRQPGVADDTTHALRRPSYSCNVISADSSSAAGHASASTERPANRSFSIARNLTSVT